MTPTLETDAVVIGGGHNGLVCACYLAQAGLKGYEGDDWFGVYAPAGMPLAIREKLSAAIREAIFSDVVKAKIDPVGVEPWGLNPAEMAALVKTERERWTGVVTKANVKLQ